MVLADDGISLLVADALALVNDFRTLFD
jgi:hypothetical protein